jgi:Putative zinc-finger
MNCVEWEERVALYAGGDLASGDAQVVEQHVAECAGCQVLLSGLREGLALAREAHSEPIEAAHFAAVRARVLAEIEGGSVRWWRHAWIYAMGAAAVVLLAVLWPRTEEHLALPTPAAPTAPTIARVALPRPTVPVHRSPAARPASAEPVETVLMKIETDNPDVVIYWIAESKGDTK